MATESNITHRVASLPLYRLPAEASFAMTLELTDYDPAGKYIELTAQSRYGRTASQVWRTATTDDTPAISISGSTVTIEIARARASVDEETLDFSDLGRNVAFAVVFRDSSSDPADFVLQGDLDFLPDRGDFDPGTAASTSVALTIATGSTVSVEVKGVIEGEAGAVTSVVGETGAVTASQIKTAYESLADTNAYTDAEKSKLDGIEASADVTDTANVTAAGALMDSEVTNLAQVKAFDSSDYATSAQGALADSAQQPPAEGAFVDGDKTKLDGIEAGADVTDTANVTAAGALMDSEVTNLAQVKAFDSSDYATSAQGALADSAVQPGDNVSDLTNDSGFISSVEGTAVLSTGETGGSKFLREDGDGTCSWQTIAGGGDMLASTYDPGSVSEQVVGLTATQTLTNKTLTTPTITLKQGTAPAPTAEGDIQWDTDDNQIKVGDGAATKVFSDDSQLATAAQGALADSAQQPPAEGAFVDGDKSKLDGIEAGADVTDTANVTAAGALMDSEVTNLAQVKAFDSSDYATSAQGALADSAVQAGDNVSDLVNDSGFISSVEGTAVLSTGETGGSKFLREDGDGTCSWQTIAGGGDMLASTYDPGSVSEQVVGLTATQTLTNKTLTTPTITLKQGTAPAPTAEGDIQWDTDDNQIKVGDGAATKVFSDDSQLATAAQGALADSAQQPPAEGAFVDGDKTKLDGIESGATAEPASVKAGEITIVINNPTTGVAGYHRIPKGYTINSASILASGSCSAVVDIWVDSITTDPPTDVTDADSITASAQPTLSSEVYATDGTLTGWTTSLTEGHWMAWNVDSVSGDPDWIKVTLETTAA